MVSNPPAYDPNLLVEIGKTSKGNFIWCDFNMGWSKDFFTHHLHDKGHKHEAFSQLKTVGYCSESFERAMQVRHFLTSYAFKGRQTIIRHLHTYFVHAKEQTIEPYTVESIQLFCQHLTSQIRSHELNRVTASGRLAAINKLLIKCGVFARPYRYSFSARASGRGMTGTEFYKPNEIGLIIHICTRLWEAYDKLINSHLDKIEKDILPKHFLSKPTHLTPTPITLNIDDIEYNYEIIASAYITTYMTLTHILFTYYTLSRKSISTMLKVKDIIKNDNGSIDTKPSLKGRGFKFVRFGIGKNTIDIDKSGLKFFECFLRTRERITRHLVEVMEELTTGKEHLERVFFSWTTNESPPALTNFESKSIWSNIFRDNHIWKLSAAGIELPRLHLPMLIKSAEMLLEDESDDPALLVEKSQHEWETYTENYGRGNPLTNLKEMSEALNIITSGAEVQATLPERQKEAKDQGINLTDEITSNISVSAHGLGCDQSLPETKIEKAFMYKMRKRNIEPKQCADLTMCLICSKCTVIEDPDCLYETLSFRQAILLNKGVYRGSKVAEADYEDIIIKLNNALELVDVKKLNAAQEKINREGLSDVWNIKI